MPPLRGHERRPALQGRRQAGPEADGTRRASGKRAAAADGRCAFCGQGTPRGNRVAETGAGARRSRRTAAPPNELGLNGLCMQIIALTSISRDMRFEASDATSRAPASFFAAPRPGHSAPAPFSAAPCPGHGAPAPTFATPWQRPDPDPERALPNPGSGQS